MAQVTESAGPDAAEFPLHVLREYALIADGERGILVGPRGDFVWMCTPGWDSEAVFSALIGGEGMYAVTPAQTPFVWGGSYEDGTLIWHSRWVTTSQVVECRDALAFPGDPHTARVLRRIQAIDGDTQVRVVLDPRAGLGRYKMSRLHRRGEIWTARCGPLYLRWTGAPEAAARPEGGLQAFITVPAGQHRDLVLEISDQPISDEGPDPGQAWAATAAAWAQAVPAISGTVADRDARNAYTVLQGLTSRGGGMVAGATTSLPERAEEGRNYDYRYAWIRDQCYTGQAVAACGPYPLLDDAVRFVTERVLADGPNLKPAYTVTGGPVPDERSLDLKGYPGGADKVGNWVNQQFQLDAFGEALMLLAAAGRHDRIGSEHWRAVETTVAAILQRGQEPDAGIWELDNQRWAHSRLSCVAGLRAIAALAPHAQGAKWSRLADQILADTAADCLHPTGRWQRAPGDDRVDAALLFPAIRGAVPADDPRTLATLAAVIDELGQDGYMYRFRQDDGPLEQAEGAFLLCGFTTSLALHQQGHEVEANRWFERNRAAAGSPGLLAEEYDIAQRQMRGNLPQAFVHALLLETAHRLARPWPGTQPLHHP
ncbi:glycoside hydrolase family 15 protein [Actinacidiphila oryziradicis]|uniref:glycoside hydrolase family 15 protein n=1 Tax=Actinacidiphila oryziradicis TaxID=2571141 RepID=UPI0023F1BB2A|nr:glycoside hydrolase family 15 protein [Actinacidiphila oryziradicis]MCW2873025.1 putative glycosyl hydrolase [Actinacidiphila oryziradicis]